MAPVIDKMVRTNVSGHHQHVLIHEASSLSAIYLVGENPEGPGVGGISAFYLCLSLHLRHVRSLFTFDVSVSMASRALQNVDAVFAHASG